MTGEGCNEELLAAYAAGACSADEVAGIEGHVRECPACRAWLDEAGSNDAIAGSVLGAIDAYAGTPPSPNEPEAETDDAALIGRKVGGFLIERVIARGGMGTVYMARQERPQRPVALKIMRAGLHSRSARRRFEYESQVLARLRHPNIAQVYEAGIHEDREVPTYVGIGPAGSEVPYFAMEFIPDARTITDYALARGLNTRQRLELFLQVCDAVHHGHQKGVIHRDLKPANILVADENAETPTSPNAESPGNATNSPHSALPGTATGRPVAGRTPHSALAKVIDFGVARSTDADIAATMLTHTGQLVGTLAYMSPEQCRADPDDIDTRSDVYSLGVVLYELLCDRMPYDVSRTNIVAAGRTICEQAPDRPSGIVRTLRGDVEKIVLKALEKDRTRRYPSADALAQDVRRYLDGEPIQARPPSAWTYLVRWSRRHPATTTAGACLAVVLAILPYTWLGVRWANYRPHRLVTSDDYSEYRLVSFTGREIHAWWTGNHSGAAFRPLNRLIAQPPELGGRRLAIIGYPGDAGADHKGSLCAYDVDRDPKTPLWAGAIARDELARDRSEDRYWGSPGVGHWDAFDIVPESPGEEIVASHAIGLYSPRCIRIYDTAGQVLFQVWHDGHVSDFLWVGHPGILVCIGDNKERPWKDREGGQDVQSSAGPQVVFAVRPRLRFLSKDFLDTKRPGEDYPLSPVWYKCLLPPKEGTDRARLVALNPPSQAEHAESPADVGIEILTDNGEWGGVSFEIDEHGDEVQGTRHGGDSYLRLASPPPLDMVKLGPLPRLVSESELRQPDDPAPKGDGEGR